MTKEDILNRLKQFVESGYELAHQFRVESDEIKTDCAESKQWKSYYNGVNDGMRQILMDLEVL